MRIVSLLPSATEIAFALGLGDQVVAVSHECDYPPEVRGRPVAVRCVFDPSGMTAAEIDATVRSLVLKGRPIYQVEWGVLEAVHPDLVLTQGLCEVCAVPEREVLKGLERLYPRPRILSLDPHGLEDVLQDILRVGEATGTLARASMVVANLRRRIQRVAEATRAVATRPRVVCLEWLDPLFVGGHWVPEMVALAGGVDVLGKVGRPSFTVSWEQVVAAQPEVLVLMPCGYSASQAAEQVHLLAQRPGWGELPAVQAGRVFATNAHAYYSRSGPRLVDGLEMLAEMLHPQVFQGFLGPERAFAVPLPALVK
ncbi:MAG: cobalamin-binding protein [Dehalococcoidia bacterium]|nr:cobalamin-binding protein [Dehalococcoidia bacterium]MDW8119475.1 cobalamin-binding protein [Chloroflexota bacterium]